MCDIFNDTSKGDLSYLVNEGCRIKLMMLGDKTRLHHYVKSATMFANTHQPEDLQKGESWKLRVDGSSRSKDLHYDFSGTKDDPKNFRALQNTVRNIKEHVAEGGFFAVEKKAVKGKGVMGFKEALRIANKTIGWIEKQDRGALLANPNKFAKKVERLSCASYHIIGKFAKVRNESQQDLISSNPRFAKALKDITTSRFALYNMRYCELSSSWLQYNEEFNSDRMEEAEKKLGKGRG